MNPKIALILLILVVVSAGCIMSPNLNNSSNTSKTGAKISQDQAVDMALDIARERNFPTPEVTKKELKNNQWEIEIQSETTTDIYLRVEIDAATGKVLQVVEGGYA